MSSLPEAKGRSQAAEVPFREAFERLKANSPAVLPVGTRLTQNNVAREAGRDPSSLKKTRFPDLIAEIQAHIAATAEPVTQVAERRPKSPELEETVEVLRRERDDLLCQLMAAKVKLFLISPDPQP